MSRITNAIIWYTDEWYKEYCVKIETLFYNKIDENPIHPVDEKDFDDKHKYYVHDSNCGKQCLPKDNCCESEKVYILSLGGKSF